MQEIKLWDLILNRENEAWKSFHAIMVKEEVCVITWQEFSFGEPPSLLEDLQKAIRYNFFPIYKCLDFQRKLSKWDNATISTYRMLLMRD